MLDESLYEDDIPLPSDCKKVEFAALSFLLGSTQFSIDSDHLIKADINIDVLDTKHIALCGHLQAKMPVKKMYADLYLHMEEYELEDVGVVVTCAQKNDEYEELVQFEVEQFDREKFVCQIFKSKRELNKYA